MGKLFQAEGTAALTPTMWERAWLIEETGRKSWFWVLVLEQRLLDNGKE